MSNLLDLISGEVPGGIILLFAAFIFVNMALIYFNKSGLVTENTFVRKAITLNLIVVVFYSFLWIYNRPDPLPQKIIVLPTVTDSTVYLDSESFLLAEIFKQNNYSIEGRYLVHRWDWLFETLTGEKHHSYKEWYVLAQKLNPLILIESRRQEGNILSVKAKIKGNVQREIAIQLNSNALKDGIKTLLKEFDLNLKKKHEIVIPNKKYLDSEIKLLNKQMDLVLKELENDTTVDARIQKGKAYVYKGLQFKYNLDKMKFVKIVNPDFENAKALLYPILKAKYDVPEITYFLGRMAIREQDYEAAEIFFKKTFTEELWNPRIYYYMSYLLSSRLEELGYKRRTVLEKAVELDPGYKDAVIDLANESYLSGTGVVEGKGTQSALGLLENYLILNPDDPDILSLLATFCIKTDRLDKAEEIYTKLMQKYPHESNFVYDLGIVAYMRADYEEALAHFKQAIAMDKNPDAYLYAGITLEMMGNKKEALKYYQDRVRYKTSDDDVYAREAMRGIRKILEEMDTLKDSLQ